MTWDDGCFFCTAGTTDCVPYALNTTSSTLLDTSYESCIQANVTGTCVRSNGSANPCDLKLYVVWTGTDSVGNFFRSAGAAPTVPAAL